MLGTHFYEQLMNIKCLEGTLCYQDLLYQQSTHLLLVLYFLPLCENQIFSQ